MVMFGDFVSQLVTAEFVIGDYSRHSTDFLQNIQISVNAGLSERVIGLDNLVIRKRLPGC
tara:strand:- start:592 stop:771 length:180 start_codon:yes stop_codon:yes gene_type:complete